MIRCFSCVTSAPRKSTPSTWIFPDRPDNDRQKYFPLSHPRNFCLMATPVTQNSETGELVQGLGLLDATTIVMGSMIGSGIFIVAAEMARELGSPGLLLLTWVLSGLMTVSAAVTYGELAAMMPRAGGQYVYLREAFGPLLGFLYGWTLFLVIQTGTIAAVAVAFGKFLGIFVPAVSAQNLFVDLGSMTVRGRVIALTVSSQQVV